MGSKGWCITLKNFESFDYDDTFKVIEILNDREILINYGSNDGCFLGEKVNIIEKGLPVRDPDTGEYLGTLDLIKDTLEICIVYDKFSLCRKVKRTIINLTSLEDFESTSISYEKIDVDDSEITYRTLPTPTKITVGDLVKIDE